MSSDHTAEDIAKLERQLSEALDAWHKCLADSRCKEEAALGTRVAQIREQLEGLKNAQPEQEDLEKTVPPARPGGGGRKVLRA
jgi:uncharacterized protein involved in exopolysaccharide biosynthesis